MRIAVKTLATLLACVACAVFTTGCSSEQLTFNLTVVATPNPVTGTADASGQRWDYEISITNPNTVGVYVDYYHAEVTGTDTGYTQALEIIKDSPVIGEWIAAGGTFTYAANRSSGGSYTRGQERRIYHTLGDDGKYYSGEVVIELE